MTTTTGSTGKPSIFFFGKMTLDFDGSKRWKEDHRGVNLISDALPFGRLWYAEPDAIGNAIGYAKHRSRSHDAVIRVYDEAGQRDQDARTHRGFSGGAGIGQHGITKALRDLTIETLLVAT